MLHILLLILKIVGIILAVILGIIILLLCIILFVPIRYEISGKCDGKIESLKAKVKATWLLRLLDADVLVKGKKLKWKIRAGWIKKSSAMIFGGQKEEVNHETKEDDSGQEVQKMDEESFEDKISEVSEEKSAKPAETVEKDRLESASEEPKEEREIHAETDKTSSEESEKESFSDKIKENIEKIKNKIRDLVQKKEKIEDFVTDKSHVHAFKKLKNELFVLLKKLKPKKINIKLRFGFDDPSTTGKILGGISILYPFLGDTTEIIPDFEKQILKGNVYIKGRIRFCHFASLALKLLLCKDIRTSYKDIRNFKL